MNDVLSSVTVRLETEESLFADVHDCFCSPASPCFDFSYLRNL